MAAQSQSLISKLQEAEKQAELIVATAKKNRLQKLKQAKDKAEEDIKAFRVEQDTKFNKEMASKASADPSRELRGATDREVEAVKQDYARNKTQTLNYVVSKVLDVATTLTSTQKQALSTKTV